MRNSVRILLFNPDRSRILLFNNHSPGDAQGWWITVGGGIEPGETPKAALHRELLEETGIDLFDINLQFQPIATRYARHVYANHVTSHHEYYWCVFLDSDRQIHFDHFTPEERKVITGTRWWSEDELANTTETIWPSDIVAWWYRGLASADRPASSRYAEFSGTDYAPACTHNHRSVASAKP